MGEGSGAIATPEVSTIRWTAPFDVLVIATVDSLGHLLGIPMRDLYLHEEACIAAFTEGLPRLQNLAGPEVPLIAPITTPVIKYGHLNSLGIPILFPETGQVALDMQPMDLGRVARLLEEKRGDDSFGGGLTGRQARYLGTLRRRFPGKRVHWGWQWEGPLTTLWALSGMQSMYAVYDEPGLFRRCMGLVTESIVRYTRFYLGVDGTSVLDPFPDHGRLCDDIAAMFAPWMWPEMVLPFWEGFFSAPVSQRKLHCEGMKPEHLPHLRNLGITDFDPGISPQLNPALIAERPWLPFCWRLGSFHYQDMTPQAVEDFVFAAAASGARYVFTVIEPLMCDEETMAKVRVLHAAGRRVREKLVAGTPRNRLGGAAEEYWAVWKGYRRS